MTIKRFLKRGLLVIPAGLLIVVAVAVGWLYRSVAPVTGNYQVTGLGERVTIRFDAFERPFVEATTLADALFAEGWLHAQHRLWQMEMFRRAGNGRLSQLLGASMLESDQQLWQMGVPQLAEQLELNASDEMKGHVAAYVAGINAALDSGASRPPEFLLLQHTPDVWTPRDVYALGALMCFQSANNSNNELLRLALFNELGDERAKIFLPQDGDQPDFPYVIPTAKLLGALGRLSATDPHDNPRMPSFAFGSNGWVVSPAKSKTGHALFAFDSHDALGLPNLFYEVHLFFGDGKQIRGWSVAGLPGVINGFNERVAWGFTNIGDTQDLFLETRSETDPRQFKDDDGWYTARTETVEIPVKGRPQAESLTITHTKNGPLISTDPPLSLSWTIQHLNGLGIDNILEFNRALSCDQYTRSLDRYAAPSLNATFADVDGNIGFRTAGLIPIRGSGSGLIPLDGSRSENRWQGFVPMQELPEVINPPSGFAAAANARVNAAENGPLISADNAPGYRIRRIQSVLASRAEFTVDDMRRLQSDWHDGQAELLMPTMIAAVDPKNLSPLVAQALQTLQAWQGNYVADPALAAPLIFQAWYRALAIAVFQPELSDELFSQLIRNNYVINHALDPLILQQPESSWWRGERGGVITTALTAAVAEIQQRQGDDITKWRLDRMHHVLWEHELGAAVPQLAWFFNAEPSPWGGGPATVGRARYRYDKPYDATAGATMRVVGEMSQPQPAMQGVIPGGQSGHPLSKHYQDQTPAWLDGRLLPIVKTADQVAGTTQILIPN
jgi:penicillin amidase